MHHAAHLMVLAEHRTDLYRAERELDRHRVLAPNGSWRRTAARAWRSLFRR